MVSLDLLISSIIVCQNIGFDRVISPVKDIIKMNVKLQQP